MRHLRFALAAAFGLVLASAAGATSASFTMSSPATFAPGDVLTITASATPDATLANLAWTLAGTL